jgi:FkbM family methyltransferase
VSVKKALRTLQVEFPFLLDLKFRSMRAIQLRLRKPFERDFSGIPLLEPPPDALFLDIGANRGQSTDAILMMSPGATVHLFEPNEELHARLQHRFGNRPDITVHNFGLGDEEMEADFYVPFYKKWMFDGLASFDEREARDWLDGRLYFFKESNVRVEKSICRVLRLDDLDLAPFFVKIDVQGFELNVLEGAERTLAAHTPVLLIETPNEAVTAFLGQRGYEHYALDGGRFHPGRQGRVNTFFLTPERAAVVPRS